MRARGQRSRLRRRSGSGGWRLRGQRPAGRLLGGQSRERMHKRLPGAPLGRHHGRLPEALLQAGLRAGALVVAALGVGCLAVAVAGAVLVGGGGHLHGTVVVMHGVALMRRSADGLRRRRMRPCCRRADGQKRHGNSDQDGQRSTGWSHGQTSKRQAQHGASAVYVKLHRGNWALQRRKCNWAACVRPERLPATYRASGALAEWVDRGPTQRSRRRSSRPSSA